MARGIRGAAAPYGSALSALFLEATPPFGPACLPSPTRPAGAPELVWPVVTTTGLPAAKKQRPGRNLRCFRLPSALTAAAAAIDTGHARRWPRLRLRSGVHQAHSVNVGIGEERCSVGARQGPRCYLPMYSSPSAATATEALCCSRPQTQPFHA